MSPADDVLVNERPKSAPPPFKPLPMKAPDVTVELLDSEEEPGGVTELAVPVAAPAIANAWFSLTGHRVRTLPIVAADEA